MIASLIQERMQRSQPRRCDDIEDLTLELRLTMMAGNSLSFYHYLSDLRASGVTTLRHLTRFNEDQFFRLFPCGQANKRRMIALMETVEVSFEAKHGFDGEPGNAVQFPAPM